MKNTVNLKISNLVKKHRPNSTWSLEHRVQVVSQYLVLGNMALVSATTGVPHQLIRAWKTKPWWKELEDQIRATENLQMDNKLTQIVDRSLDVVLDRVEKGDFIYDQKTGQVVRKPVNMKDAAKVSVDLITKRELLRGNATERHEGTQVSVAEQLKMLALEFAKWQKPQKEVIDAEDVEIKETDDAIHDEWEEGLQEGESEVQLQTESSESEGGTESEPTSLPKSGESP